MSCGASSASGWSAALRGLWQASDHCQGSTWLVVSARPYNPEGMSFVSSVALEDAGNCWRINGKDDVRFSAPAERQLLSNYADGDVYLRLLERSKEKAVGSISCQAGLASAAALFRLKGRRSLEVTIPLLNGRPAEVTVPGWQDERYSACRLQCPDPKYQYLL